MAYVSLYRRFRPSTFDGVIGQNHITRTLINQIKSGNIGHAYLFTGTRGTGKTTCAKIFARAVNCLSPKNGSPCGECEVCVALKNQNSIDVLEIDAASNNGVEEIRTLKENVYYRPTVGRYKVYIIDEVHMLSTSAFNALLKTLEEPPEHVVFILATTEVHKIPQTILSRCLRFDFRLVDEERLVGLLKNIFDELGVGYEETALYRIAVSGEGSVRDTLSVADMCMSYCDGKITKKEVLEILCATDFSDLDELGGAILNGDCRTALDVLGRLIKNGRTTVYKDLAKYFSDLLAVKNVPDYKPSSLSETEFCMLKKRCDVENYRISRAMDILTESETKIRYSSQPRIVLEAAVVRACEMSTDIGAEAVFVRMNEMENKLKDLTERGITVAAVSPAPPPPKEDAATPQKEEPKPKEDITSRLEEVAKPVDGEMPFDENAAQSAGDEDKNAWFRIIGLLEEMKETMLCFAAKDIKVQDISRMGDDYIVETADNAVLEVFERSNNKKTVQSLLRKELDDDKLVFVCRAKKKEVFISEADQLTLNRLFDGSLRFKKE